MAYAAAQLIRVLPRERMGRAVGRLADVRWSPRVGRAIVELYSRAYKVSFDECEQRAGFTSFDAFFTRALRAGARPLPRDSRVLVSPADGRVESMARIDERSTFLVKGRPYSVAELLGDDREAARYSGGAGCVVYLSPRDYHRVHSPVDGALVRVRSIAGDFFPVNSIGMRHVKNLFARNRRVVLEIDAERGPSGGSARVAVVMVVAMIVGRITVSGVEGREVPFGDHALHPPRRVHRGDEIGMFHLGSTAVVLVERSAAGAWLAAEGPVKYGAALMAPPGEGVTRSTNGSGARTMSGGER